MNAPDLIVFVREAASRVFMPCGLAGCHAHSLGFVCSTCSRPCCQRHAYIRPAAVLRRENAVVCVSCIVDEHKELWDDNVFEAEVVK
ncbi:MAG: hypothetical protein EBS90_07610 [Betaproteobacteria bacterium]|nr:hypothetical protein [Betaproteobacteria bacterium]